ncbi:glycoside hydrolase, partial [Polyplosphaeria fusca]
MVALLAALVAIVHADPKCGSANNNNKCPLNVCCSSSGNCGTDQDSCGSGCREDFGRCGTFSPKSCGMISGTATNGRSVGVFDGWNINWRKCNVVHPKDLNTTGLTHLLWAYASIDPTKYTLVPSNESDTKFYKEFTDRKSKDLQTWISVGGWHFSDEGPTRKTWSEMAADYRSTFVDSAVKFMDKHGFQGLDLDWQFPGASDRGGTDQDISNHIRLAVDLRNAFGTKYGLSIVLPSDWNFLQHFDPKALEAQVDFFNIMMYDFHGAWETWDNHMLPHNDLREVNIRLMPLFFNNVSPKKINLGLSYHGQGYTVKDKSCSHIGCAFSGPSKPGRCTDYEGMLSNWEINEIIHNNTLTPGFVDESQVRSLQWDDQLVFYDDDETYLKKKVFANDRCLGGLYISSLDLDPANGDADKPVSSSAVKP